MSNLEKYISDHQAEFISEEPEQGHFKRFEDRLDGLASPVASAASRPRLLKIAALIIVLISMSVFVFDFATREIRERFAFSDPGSELPQEIREAVQYYDSQTSTQIATIRQLAQNQKDGIALGESTMKEIRSLDATTDELKRSFAENPGNEQVLDAIIRNQQMKEAMLNNIITQLSQYRR
jgi:hypothetical protein